MDDSVTIRLTGLDIDKLDSNKSYCVLFTIEGNADLHVAHNVKFNKIKSVFCGSGYYIYLERVVKWIPQTKVDDVVKERFFIETIRR